MPPGNLIPIPLFVFVWFICQDFVFMVNDKVLSNIMKRYCCLTEINERIPFIFHVNFMNLQQCKRIHILKVVLRKNAIKFY